MLTVRLSLTALDFPTVGVVMAHGKQGKPAPRIYQGARCRNTSRRLLSSSWPCSWAGPAQGSPVGCCEPRQPINGLAAWLLYRRWHASPASLVGCMTLKATLEWRAVLKEDFACLGTAEMTRTAGGGKVCGADEATLARSPLPSTRRSNYLVLSGPPKLTRC